MGRGQKGPCSQLRGTVLRSSACWVNEEQMWEAGLAPTSELGTQLDFLSLTPPVALYSPLT